MITAAARAAVREWRDRIGARFVDSSAAPIAACEQATYPTDSRIVAILKPATVEQVRACVDVATRHRVPLYPISGGRNWGYGSRVPPADGCAVLDLGRLHRIVGFDERLAYMTVQAGVTFDQAYSYLRRRRSRLMLSPVASSGQATIVGNALERGFGAVGPLAHRFEHVCDLRVILPTGEEITTGFDSGDNGTASRVHRYGRGPAVAGLFSQSNLGIVVSMTVWLARVPTWFDCFELGLGAPSRLGPLVDGFRELFLAGILRNPLKLQNGWAYLAGAGALSAELAQGVSPAGRPHSRCWIARGTAFYANPHARRSVRSALRSLRSCVDGLTIRGEEQIPPDLRAHVLGRPSDAALNLAYCRKRIGTRKDRDPDRDRCGLLFAAVVVPALGRDVERAVKIATGELERRGVPPLLTITMLDSRFVYLVVSIVYDRDAADDERRALESHDALVDCLERHGYPPYRLTTRAMPRPTATEPLLRRLRAALDPHEILAPRRYAGDGRARGA